MKCSKNLLLRKSFSLVSRLVVYVDIHESAGKCDVCGALVLEY